MQQGTAGEQARSTGEQTLQAIVQNLPDSSVLLVDEELRFVSAEGPALPILLERLNLETVVGLHVTEVSSNANRRQLADALSRVFSGETHHLQLTRDRHHYDLTLAPIRDGERVCRALVLLRDVTARSAERAEITRLERELAEASVTDSLTGLLSRRGLTLIAEQEMRTATRDGRELLLLFVDLNGMTRINETLGHEMGDRALIDAAKLLRDVFRTSDAVARLGGDVFAVLATDAIASSGPAIVARLNTAVAQHKLSNPAYDLVMSIGVAIFDPAIPHTFDQLLTEADARMSEAKLARRR